MITIKKRFIITALIFFAFCIICSLFFERTYTKTEYGLFDTVCTITETSSIDLTNKYMNILRDIYSEIDAFDKNSKISKLNRGETVTFSKGIHNHLNRVTSLSHDLGKYFTISLEPVYKIWNEAIDKKEVPDYELLKSRLGNQFGIVLGDDNPFLFIDHTALLIKDSSSISLGATAKGYATKAVLDEIKKDRVKSALINLGGNIYAHGTKPDGSLWTVGIADPKNPAQSSVILECKDIAVITSGDYERYFEIDGKRYHHIIDPSTLMPAESGIHSATAIGSDAELCDIMSTSLFVAGIDNAKELCLAHGVDAILISDDKIYYTDGAFDLIKSTDEKYTLIEL